MLSSYFWTNAGFGSLRKIKKLDDFEPRYDPTVIPISNESKPELPDSSLQQLDRLAQGGGEGNVDRQYSIADYHTAYRAGKVTPSTVARALLDLISTSDHGVAFLTVRKQQALAEAEQSTVRYKEGKPLGVLDGVPVAVKDEVDLDGCEKSLGSARSFTRIGGGTSWCVQKWKEAGAIIIGKTNMHELGLGMLPSTIVESEVNYIIQGKLLHLAQVNKYIDTTNNNPIKGTPLNPHNSHYYTGGSSGGSAYAVSAGLVPIALGADGGGSIRIPSAYCGLYGLKPSHGRVSGSPTLSLASTCGVLGPHASNLNDLEIAYHIMATADPNNPSSSFFSSSIPSSPSRSPPKLLGLFKSWFDHADPPVHKACEAALSHYQSAGYTIVDIDIPYISEGQLAHAITILAEISGGIHDLTGLTPANKITLSVGKQTPASDFLLAQKMRQLLMQHLAFLFRSHPGLIIVTPTTPNAGWHISGGQGDLKHGISDANMSVRSMEYVWLANFSGCPALSIPVGTAEPKDGQGRVPIGLMGMGEWGAEEELLKWGRIGEQWNVEKGDGKVGRPQNWVDVMGLTGL